MTPINATDNYIIELAQIAIQEITKVSLSSSFSFYTYLRYTH